MIGERDDASRRGRRRLVDDERHLFFDGVLDATILEHISRAIDRNGDRDLEETLSGLAELARDVFALIDFINPIDDDAKIYLENSRRKNPRHPRLTRIVWSVSR